MNVSPPVDQCATQATTTNGKHLAANPKTKAQEWRASKQQARSLRIRGMQLTSLLMPVSHPAGINNASRLHHRNRHSSCFYTRTYCRESMKVNAHRRAQPQVDRGDTIKKRTDLKKYANKEHTTQISSVFEGGRGGVRAITRGKTERKPARTQPHFQATTKISPAVQSCHTCSVSTFQPASTSSKQFSRNHLVQRSRRGR